jgi:hypothetical protein
MNALENASPARVAALAIPVRAARSDPSATARGSHWKIIRIACAQKASVYGDAKMETAASRACVRASRPVSAVAAGDSDTVRAGSTMAMSGTRQ